MSTQLARSTSTPPRAIDSLRDFLETPAARGWLEKQIHRSMQRSAEDLVNVVLHSAAQNDKLARCTPKSVLAALVSCAQLGLIPNTRLGHAHIVPFKNRRKVGNTWQSVDEAQIVFGYQGLVLLMHGATGATVQAAAVRKGDRFHYNLAADQVVQEHVYGDGDRGELIAAYAIAKLQKGGRTEIVLTREMVERRRDRSAGWAYEDGRAKSPWTTDTEAMWRKTAVRALANMVPMGPDERLRKALEIEDAQVVEGSVPDLIEIPADVEEAAAAVETTAAVSKSKAQEAREGAQADALAGLAGR